jgi:hypothetical protein
MREPVGKFEGPRGFGKCSKQEPQSWEAIVREHASGDWPPADRSGRRPATVIIGAHDVKVELASRILL